MLKDTKVKYLITLKRKGGGTEREDEIKEAGEKEEETISSTSLIPLTHNTSRIVCTLERSGGQPLMS